MTDEDELKKLNEEFNEKEQQGDEAAKAWFDGVLSDKLLFRRASKMVVNKKSFRDGLVQDKRFTSRTMEDFKVTPCPDRRVLVTMIVHTIAAADKKEEKFRNIRLFSKQGNKWQLEFWYNYNVTEP